MPFPFKGDSLIGKSNYIEWKTKADLYLEINGYMPYIDGSKEKPNKSLYFKTTIKGDERTITDEPYSPETAIKYYERLTEHEENQNKAPGALKSILSIENIERFKTIKTAYSLYQEIKKTFGETSFEQIGIYLDKLNYTQYSEAKNMDTYTSIIQSSYYSLKQLGHAPSKANIAWQLLKGLPVTDSPTLDPQSWRCGLGIGLALSHMAFCILRPHLTSSSSLDLLSSFNNTSMIRSRMAP